MPDRLLELRVVQARDRGLDARHVAPRLEGDDAVVEEARRLAAHPQLGELLAHGRVGGQPRPLHVLDQQLEDAPRARVAGDPDALEGEPGGHDLPAAVPLAEQAVARHADPVEEDLVQLVRTGHAADRPHADAGRAHVDEEDGEARVAGGVRRGAGEEEAPVGGRVGVAVPGLLAVDHEVVAALLGARRDRRQVGAGARLGEALRPHHGARRHGGEKAPLLRLAPEAHDAGADVVEVHVLRPARLLVRPHLLAENRLLPRARVLPAVRARPGHGEPAAGRELRAEGPRERERARVVDEHAAPPGRQLLGEEGAQLGAEALLLVGEREVHVRARPAGCRRRR